MAISVSLHDRMFCNICISCVVGGSGILRWTAKKYNSQVISYIHSILCTYADTCDPTWQPTRDDLIISAHVFSDISFLVAIATLLFAATYKFKGKEIATKSPCKVGY